MDSCYLPQWPIIKLKQDLILKRDKFHKYIADENGEMSDSDGWHCQFVK